MAGYKGQRATVSFLLHEGADPRIKTSQGRDVLSSVKEKLDTLIVPPNHQERAALNGVIELLHTHVVPFNRSLPPFGPSDYVKYGSAMVAAAGGIVSSFSGLYTGTETAANLTFYGQALQVGGAMAYTLAKSYQAEQRIVSTKATMEGRNTADWHFPPPDYTGMRAENLYYWNIAAQAGIALVTVAGKSADYAYRIRSGGTSTQATAANLAIGAACSAATFAVGTIIETIQQRDQSRLNAMGQEQQDVHREHTSHVLRETRRRYRQLLGVPENNSQNAEDFPRFNTGARASQVPGGHDVERGRQVADYDDSINADAANLERAAPRTWTVWAGQIRDRTQAIIRR